MYPSKVAAPPVLLVALSCVMLLAYSPTAVNAQGPSVLGKLLGTVRFNASSGNATTCPPPGFDSLANFSLRAYAAAPWYVQKQAPVVYQPVSSLYCVRAIYTLLNSSNPSQGVDVNNYANRGGVNGRSEGNRAGLASSFRMEGLPDPAAGNGTTAASKLIVGPAVLRSTAPRNFSAGFGPYWVVAAGPSSNSTLGYDWAIVTGGAPRTATAKGCRTGGPGPLEVQYLGGLWLFSRKPVDPNATALMESKAQALGLDTSVLKPVQQQGCKYT